MTLLIPVLSKTPNLFKELVRIIPNVTFHEVERADDAYFKNSEILICDFDLLGPHLYSLPHAKWVQGTWAGVDAFVKYYHKSRLINYKITRFSGEHFGKIMGEYVVANIVNHERNLFEAKRNQKMSLWKTEGKIEDYRVIYDLTIGIMGVGSIGNRIGKILKVLGARILALGRREYLEASDEYSHIYKYYAREKLHEFLRKCDYVVSVLPNTPETDNILDGDILENCKERGTVLINIGRGNIISEDSLVKALNNKWISAAILDVFTEEPLPIQSPLWNFKQVFITPHVAGRSRARDIAEQFKTNLELYQKQLPLQAVLDLDKGY